MVYRTNQAAMLKLCCELASSFADKICSSTKNRGPGSIRCLFFLNKSMGLRCKAHSGLTACWLLRSKNPNWPNKSVCTSRHCGLKYLVWKNSIRLHSATFTSGSPQMITTCRGALISKQRYIDSQSDSNKENFRDMPRSYELLKLVMDQAQKHFVNQLLEGYLWLPEPCNGYRSE